MKKTLLLFFLLFFSVLNYTQINLLNGIPVDFDKCGFDTDKRSEFIQILGDHWGYSYDSLLSDLEIWKLSSYVKIDSIGLSVQGRPLWRLTISENPNDISSKRTIHIHARTHPQETEGFWVTKEMIDILLSQTEFAQTVRTNCVIYVIPMFNPDGVELKYTRQNANGVDLESNWFTIINEPEVAALKVSFIQLMAAENPIEVALNMHSSSLCERYFVYHDTAGTSTAFTIKEKNFINGIRIYYPNGIQPWDYFISWTIGTPLKYPESWFWINHGESVMALTYEDMYQCSQTGNFDITASALLNGIMDYMDIVTDVQENVAVFDELELKQNYPNPFNSATNLEFRIAPAFDGGFVSLKVYDVLGKQVATLVSEEKSAGNYQVVFDAGNLSSGVYFCKLIANNFTQTKKMILAK